LRQRREQIGDGQHAGQRYEMRQLQHDVAAHALCAQRIVKGMVTVLDGAHLHMRSLQEMFETQRRTWRQAAPLARHAHIRLFE